MFHRRWLCAIAAALLLLLSACAPDQAALPGPGGIVTEATPATSAVPVEQESEPAPEISSPAIEEDEQEPTVEGEDAPEAGLDPDPQDSESPSAEPSAAPPAPLYSPGESSETIRELQHRLLQISWLSGEITDTYDQRTQAAVDGFQAKRGFPVLGYVDKATWDRLVEMTRTPSHEEMHNIVVAGPPIHQRGDSGNDIRDLQARLKQIGWFSDKVTGNYGPVTETAVRGFQGKRELPTTGAVDQDTLDALHRMTRKPTEAELTDAPAASPSEGSTTLDSRCMTGRAVCVSKQQRQLAWVIDGQVQFTLDVRFGSELTPTREGVFSIGWKSRDHVSSIYHTPMPFALFFSGGQAIHYSADFASNGYNGASHGCVNVRDRALAQTLFETTRVGDRVVVY